MMGFPESQAILVEQIKDDKFYLVEIILLYQTSPSSNDSKTNI